VNCICIYLRDTHHRLIAEAAIINAIFRPSVREQRTPMPLLNSQRLPIE